MGYWKWKSAPRPTSKVNKHDICTALCSECDAHFYSAQTSTDCKKAANMT